MTVQRFCKAVFSTQIIPEFKKKEKEKKKRLEVDKLIQMATLIQFQGLLLLSGCYRGCSDRKWHHVGGGETVWLRFNKTITFAVVSYAFVWCFCPVSFLFRLGWTFNFF